MGKKVTLPDNSILYASQENWEPKEFAYVKAILNKNFLYQDLEQYGMQIANYDLFKMKDTTKAIMKALLLYYKNYDEMLKKYPNLKALDDVGPLEQPLYLSKHPFKCFKEFTKMNIYL